MASLTGETKGNAYQQSNIASNDLLPLTGKILDVGLPAFQNYSQWLNQITSNDPAMRVKAAAPEIAQQTQQQKQVQNQLKNLPRGGEQNTLRAQAIQSGATNTGDLLNKLFTSGETAKGELGQKAIADYFGGITDAGQLYSSAASIEQNQQQLDAATRSSSMGALGSLASMFAGLVV